MCVLTTFIMNITTVFISILILLSTIGVGPVSAGSPEQVDQCSVAPELEPGSHSSVMTPDGTDVFTIDTQLEPGDYIEFDFEFDESEFNEENILRMAGAIEEGDSLYGYSGVSYDDNYIGDDGLSARGGAWSPIGAGGSLFRFLDTDSTGELWAEESGSPCIMIFSRGNGAGEYSFSFDVKKSGGEESEASTNIESLESEIESLESENTKLENRVKELEDELEDAEPEIDITVEPEGQARFKAGGQMAVTVESETIRPSDLSLQFNGEQYSLGGGEATIPLQSGGEQQLSVGYEGILETVTIDVEERQAPTGEETTKNETPGFSIIAILLAFTISIIMIKYRS